MKLIPYPQYKDSGIEWLGEVPEEWGIIRTDSVTTYIRSQINPEDIKSELVFHYSIPVVQDTGTGQLEPTEDLGSAKQLITKKAILVSKLNPRKATICIAEPQDEVTICSSEFVAMKATKCDIEYLYYLVNSEKNRQRLDASVQSVTRSHQRVYPSDIYKFWTALPNWEDQQAIAAFLDRETSRIDALIQKKERLIELLKEKRIALITQAVTKGLDPTVPMKDSGIEWLGEVPEHWETAKVGFGYSIQLGKMLQPEPDKPSDFPVNYLKAVNVQWDEITVDDETMMWASNSDKSKYKVQIGDLLVCEGGEAGRAAILEFEVGEMIIQNALHRVRSSDNNVRYLLYLLHVASNQGWFDILCNKATIAHFTRDKFSELRIPFPSSQEQDLVVSHIQDVTVRTKGSVDKISKSITLLREYRSSLINAAVTGKIDLREAL